MANNYLMKYKGKYRLMSPICLDTNDFVRLENGAIDPDAEVYIPCKYDSKIWAWGKNSSNRMLLEAYIPNQTRGNNIKKKLKKQGIEIIEPVYFNERKTKQVDEENEITFRFKATDIDVVAELMGAKTYGANISPFSTKNLPKAKVEIPQQDIALYKDISSKVGTAGMSVIKDANKRFMDEILAIKLKKSPRSKKPFNYKSDMKKLKMSRMTKEYIYSKGLWSEYVVFMEEEVDKYLAEKGNDND